MAFHAGVSSGAAEAAIAEGATVVYQPSGYSPFGAIFGLFFVLLLIGFVMKAFFWRRMSYAAGGWGGHNGKHGSWDRDDVPERFRPMLEGWHRRAHDGPPSDDGDAGSVTQGAAPTRTPPGPTPAPRPVPPPPPTGPPPPPPGPSA